MVDISALNSDGGENHHPDYSVARVDLKDHPEKGRALPYIFWELKRSNEDDKFEEDKFTCNKKKAVHITTYLWEKILNQMWDQCDTTNTQMNGNGRMWTIGQREFEICFF